MQTASDRPDLVARVFNLKVKAFLAKLIQHNMLGVVIGYIYVVEFQKRGLPHAHILLIMASGDLLHTPDDYDTAVCAELPDPVGDPILYRTVSRYGLSIIKNAFQQCQLSLHMTEKQHICVMQGQKCSCGILREVNHLSDIG